MLDVKRVSIAAATIAMTASGLAVMAPAADAAGIYTNCTSLHTRWKHGVGKRYARDHTSGTPVTNFYHSTYQYRIAINHNSRLDADKDGIACEAH